MFDPAELVAADVTVVAETARGPRGRLERSTTADRRRDYTYRRGPSTAGMDPLLSDDPGVDPQYRMEPAELDWPADLNLAVCLTFDTQGAIDGLREGYQTTRWPDGAPNWWDYTERQYGMTRGLPRVLDVLEEQGVTATFPTCGLTAEWYPDRVAEIVERGHEIANHTHTHRLLYGLDAEEERADIAAAAEALEAVTGEQPAGFRCPVYSTSEDTVGVLAEAGYEWESSFHNHDRPYYLTDGDRRVLEVPVHLDDWTLFLMETRQGGSMGGYPRGTPHGVRSVLEAEIDRLHAEGTGGAPRVFTLVMHPKIIGRPHRATVLEAVVEHAAAKPGVEFLTCSEVAAMAG